MILWSIPVSIPNVVPGLQSEDYHTQLGLLYLDDALSYVKDPTPETKGNHQIARSVGNGKGSLEEL